VIYFSDSFASSDDSVRLPGFVRVDAAVYAKIDEMWRVQLNVENIFNRVTGRPLTATTTLRRASRARSV
jgi:outer membrane receptor protein involved in Fe transport